MQVEHGSVTSRCSDSMTSTYHLIIQNSPQFSLNNLSANKPSVVRVVLVYPRQTQITGMRVEWCIFTYTHDDVCPRCQVSIILYKLIIHKTVRRRTVYSWLALSHSFPSLPVQKCNNYKTEINTRHCQEPRCQPGHQVGPGGQ